MQELDIDLQDYPERREIYYHLYNLTKAGIISHIRTSTSGNNFHGIQIKDYPLLINDPNYPQLTAWKGIRTLTRVKYKYFWCGKECRTKVGECSEWFVFDEIELARHLEMS